MKNLFRVMLILVVLFLCSIWYILLPSLSKVNSYGSKLMCENTLKMIATALKQYQLKMDGQWPPSLLELGPYYEGKYNPGPNRIPKCPGDRNKQEMSISSEYYYFPPKDEEIVPVCWDSKPHCMKGISNTFLWNILYSDGHIESLSKRELFRELSQLAKTNADVLKVLNLLDEKKYGN